MRYVGLFALILARAVMGIPRAILRSMTGLGYRDRFEIGVKAVNRPAHFRSKAHKRAFEAVGRYVTDALTRDVMLSFQAKHLTDPNGLWGYHKVPLEIWREVLAWYEEQGCIVRRWQLGIPSYGEHLHVPSWDARGERVAASGDHGIGGLVPDSVAFCPSLLTDAQKAELIGKPYALHPNDCLSWQKKGQEYVTLEDKHFELTYFRRRADLTDASLEQGAKTLQSVFKAAAKS